MFPPPCRSDCPRTVFKTFRPCLHTLTQAVKFLPHLSPLRTFSIGASPALTPCVKRFNLNSLTKICSVLCVTTCHTPLPFRVTVCFSTSPLLQAHLFDTQLVVFQRQACFFLFFPPLSVRSPFTSAHSMPH